MSYVIQDMKMNNSWTIAEGIVRPTVVLCRVRLAGFSKEFLFDSLEMEERKLSASTNGSPSGYIYGGMDFLPFGPTYFSAFLFGEVSQHSIWRTSTVLCRYVHFFWIQNTWTHNQWKKQRRKVLDHVTSERTRSTYIFIINIQIKATQTCTVQIILHNMISLRLKGIIVNINFMFFWKGTNNGVGSA